MLLQYYPQKKGLFTLFSAFTSKNVMRGIDFS